MTTHEMLALLKQRTKVADETKRLNELWSAYRWAVKRIYNSSDGPKLLSTVGLELAALTGTTKTYDLAAAVKAANGGDFLGVKKLWVKLPSDTRFVPMEPADSNEPDFVNADSDPAANLTVAQGHPVQYDVINFAQARFAPALPATAVVRIDVFRIAPPPGLDESSDLESSSDLDKEPVVGQELPAIFHEAMVWKATAQLFHGLDDVREAIDERRATGELDEAIYMAKRNQSPTVTQPFRPRRRRFI